MRKVTYLNPGSGEGLFYEEENILGAPLMRRHYIEAGGRVVGALAWDGSAWSAQYWHADQVGSPTVVTDAGGAVLERLGYEPFGKRRNPLGASDAAGTLTASTTQRGFTGHEHDDTVGLIDR